MGQAVFKRIQFSCNYFLCKLAGIRVAGKQPTAPVTSLLKYHQLVLSRLKIYKRRVLKTSWLRAGDVVQLIE